jgi:hydroxymethylpyrimidine kinase/phosphomethylpyrimidine kinase
LQRVLTIAGLDPGGGAGIATDLKTIALLGAHGLCVTAALTAQNSLGVRAIQAVAPAFVEEQLEAVLADIGCDACKCGMLYSAGVVQAVAAALARHRVPNLVVDTVLAAGSGDSLAEAQMAESLPELFPLAALVTGNLAEVSVLTGLRVADEAGMRQAARKLVAQGARAALVRGGHLGGGEAVDILYDGEFTRFACARVDTPHEHGTGCTLSSAVATYLARGHELRDAISRAKDLVRRGLTCARPLGAGKGPVNIFPALAADGERCRVLEELAGALELLRGAPIGRLVPEVGMNLAFALPAATSAAEVAAFPGRLRLYHGRLTSVGPPEFGASSHVARIVLSAMAREPGLRSAINIRHGADVLAACRRAGLSLASFDRAQEPPEVAAREGGSLGWGVEQALAAGPAPQAIYDAGGPGKEPMVRLLGRTPGEVAGRVAKIGALLEEQE